MIYDPLHLLHLQLELECKSVDDAGFVHRVPCDDPDDIASVLIARHAGGYTVYFDHALEADLVEQLRAIPAPQLFEDEGVVRALLRPAGRDEGIWRGSSYYFAEAPAMVDGPAVVVREGAFVMLVGGEPVSWAWSARSNEKAAELAVETRSGFRRRGFAYQVTAAWARYQLAQGKVAFYSHLHDNVPSVALAQKLGVVHFMAVVGYG